MPRFTGKIRKRSTSVKVSEHVLLFTIKSNDPLALGLQDEIAALEGQAIQILLQPLQEELFQPSTEPPAEEPPKKARK